MLIFQIFGSIDPNYLIGGYVYHSQGDPLALFIANIIKVVYIVAGVAFFLYLAMGGLRYITAGGDVKQTQEASKQVTSSIIGLAIVVGSYAITTVVGNIMGINIFNFVFPKP